jgi:hypothetical protein
MRWAKNRASISELRNPAAKPEAKRLPEIPRLSCNKNIFMSLRNCM